MLTCKDITERVTAYMEHELSWPEWIPFMLHVAMCRLCRRYVSQMQATRATLQRIGARRRDDAVAIDPVVRDAFRAWRDESRAQ